MPHSVLVPITNVYAKGDFTAEVHIGSKPHRANLILDTGSSTLVVRHEDYQPHKDSHLQATELVQDITYGMGGWYGPLVKTQVTIGEGAFQVSLTATPLAVTQKAESGCFGEADGLLGLAYQNMNRAYNLCDYLLQHAVQPALTYPWFLAPTEQNDSVRDFRQFLHHFPSQTVAPYFSQLEEQGVVADQFAFIIHRSSIYQTHQQQPTERLKTHPLNNGWFIMGRPKLHQHLYQGELNEVKVQHDKYYNVTLLSMQVGKRALRQAPPLAEHEVAGYISNAIIDSGASMLMLPETLFTGLLDDLSQCNPNFSALLEPFKTFCGREVGIDLEKITLADWPDIHFTFEGFDDQKITLTLTPDTYWQTQAPEPGLIAFKFVNLPHWPNQSVMGLPLMNNYFTIFDRAERQHGAVIFADKRFAPHRLGEACHRNMQAMQQLASQHCPLQKCPLQKTDN